MSGNDCVADGGSAAPLPVTIGDTKNAKDSGSRGESDVGGQESAAAAEAAPNAKSKAVDAVTASMTFASFSTLKHEMFGLNSCDCDECGAVIAAKRRRQQQQQQQGTSAGDDGSGSSSRMYVPAAIADALESYKRRRRNGGTGGNDDSALSLLRRKRRIQDRALLKREGPVSVWEYTLPRDAQPLVEFGTSHRIVHVKRLQPVGSSRLLSIGPGIVGSLDEERRRRELSDWKHGDVWLLPGDADGKAVGFVHVNSDDHDSNSNNNADNSNSSGIDDGNNSNNNNETEKDAAVTDSKTAMEPAGCEVSSNENGGSVAAPTSSKDVVVVVQEDHSTIGKNPAGNAAGAAATKATTTTSSFYATLVIAKIPPSSITPTNDDDGGSGGGCGGSATGGTRSDSDVRGGDGGGAAETESWSRSLQAICRKVLHEERRRNGGGGAAGDAAGAGAGTGTGTIPGSIQLGGDDAQRVKDAMRVLAMS